MVNHIDFEHVSALMRSHCGFVRCSVGDVPSPPSAVHHGTYLYVGIDYTEHFKNSGASQLMDTLQIDVICITNFLQKNIALEAFSLLVITFSTYEDNWPLQRVYRFSTIVTSLYEGHAMAYRLQNKLAEHHSDVDEILAGMTTKWAGGADFATS